MCWKTVLSSLVTLAVALSVSFRAFGQDQDCSSGINKRYYDQGFGIQKNVISYLWTEDFKKECNNFESFFNAVSVPLDLFNGSHSESPSLQCRNQGVAAGFHAAIEDIENDCTTDCLQNGSKMGELLGLQACARSIVTMPMSASLCEYEAQSACRSAVTSYINQNCPHKSYLLDSVMSGCAY